MREARIICPMFGPLDKTTLGPRPVACGPLDDVHSALEGKLLEHFGGGGHAKAAGCRLEATEEEALRQILAQARETLSGKALPRAEE